MSPLESNSFFSFSLFFIKQREKEKKQKKEREKILTNFIELVLLLLFFCLQSEQGNPYFHYKPFIEKST